MALDLLEQILPYIRRAMYPQSVSLEEWKIKESDLDDASNPRLNDKSWAPFRIPSFWGGYDRTAWFRKEVVIPPELSGKPVVLLLDIPEALIYINGKPYQGVDRNHKEVFLTSKARTGQSFHVAIQAYSGRTTSVSNFNDARLAVVYPTAKSLAYGLSLLRDVERLHGSVPGESKEIREVIRKTLIFLKYFSPDGEEYPNAIGRALNYLRAAIEEEHKSQTPGTIHLVSQSHLDVLWLWTLKETRRKAARTFSTMVRLAEEFPDFRYTQSQAQLYQFVDESYPTLAKEISSLVSAGRWEVLSAMWVEADCNIPSGESLVRQILHGKEYSMRRFGIDPSILWLPDSFGFPGSLPQIMNKSGIKYFFTTKLSWNDTTRFPYQTFQWKGIDGSSVLSHIPPVGLEGHVQPKYLRSTWTLHEQKESSPLVMQTFGFGDGGGGPTKENIVVSHYLRDFSGFPRIQSTSASEFFQQLEQQSEDVPVWEDELYLERHRGTFTTNSEIKKDNRKCEVALFDAELLSVLSSLNNPGRSGNRYPADDLAKIWKTILLHQFHDTIAGTIIKDAEEEVRSDFSAASSALTALIDRSVQSLRDRSVRPAKGIVFTVFNTLPWTRTGYVELSFKSSDRHMVITDDRSRLIEYQVLKRSRGIVTVLCFLEDVPPTSAVRLTVSAGKADMEEPIEWKLKPRVMETPIFRVRLDAKGNISSLYDKRLRRELVAKGGVLNELQTFTDKPKEWEAWEIDAEFESRRHPVFRFTSSKIVESGPLRASLQLTFKTPAGSVLTQNVMFYHRIPLVEMHTQVRWIEKQTLLKVAFPLNIKASHVTNEIQFGSVRRTTKPKNPPEKAKFEIPMQQWVDFSDTRCGVSILNDSKYGYDAKENTIRLTLLRSPHYPHDTEPHKLSGNGIIDKGDHEFRYGLFVHHGDWKKGETGRRAREFNHSFRVFPKSAVRTIQPLLTSLPPQLAVDAIKQSESENDVILRLHESFGDPLRATLEFGYVVDQVYECDLLERPITKLKASRGKVRLKFSPFEIKTLRLKLRAYSGKRR